MEGSREGGQGEEGVRAKEERAEGRAEQMRREQNRTERGERAGEGRGEEGRRGWGEVMMWQRWKDLKFFTKDPICKYSHKGEILGSRLDLGLKLGSRF